MDVSQDTNASDDSPVVYPPVVLLSVLATVALLFSIPALILQFRSRTLPSVVLIVICTLGNLNNITNPIIWPDMNTETWYDGKIFCDIQAKLQVFYLVAIPGTTTCICKRLASYLSAGTIGAASSPKDMWKRLVVEVALCIILPSIIAGLHTLVQPVRYVLFGSLGCQWAILDSWMSVVLVLMWPLLLNITGLGYNIIIIVRIIRHHSQITTILASANTSKARFARLYILATILILYTSYPPFAAIAGIARFEQPWTWLAMRSYIERWNKTIIYSTDGGRVQSSRWIDVAGGFALFLAYGLGNDAQELYRSWVRILRLDKTTSRLLFWVTKKYKRSRPELRHAQPELARAPAVGGHRDFDGQHDIYELDHRQSG